MKRNKNLDKLFFLSWLLAGLLFGSADLFAQEKAPGPGMMGGDRPPEMIRMMQEPNKVLANASIDYMYAFTHALHLQAARRPDQIDQAFIQAAFGEIKRSYGLIEQFQKAHVQTMDAAMQARVQMMMGRMNRNLTGLKENLDLLEKEISAGKKLEGIVARTGGMLQYLDDLLKMRAGQSGPADSPPKKMMP